jgi:CheY-like chemotaxis protein
MRDSLSETRVLLVDDNTLNLLLIRKLLGKWGAIVETAENGQIAVDLAQQHHDANTPYEVIIMDLQMPVMDGFTACQTIRQFDKSVIILAASASALSADEIISNGFSDCLVKPFDANQLQEKLRTSLV